MKKAKFIERKWLLVILLVSLIEPFHYFLLLNFPLQGRTFMGYDSDEGIRIIEEVMRFIANAAYKTSADLAEEKVGWKVGLWKIGMREPQKPQLRL